MRFVNIPAILSTAPDLSCVVIRKRHRENRETFSVIKPLLIICPYFGWFVTFRCMRGVTNAPGIASTVANKLRWKICSDKIHYKSHINLRNAALVLFKLRQIIFTLTASDTDFPNTGLLPASDKLAIKYRQGRWNTRHLTTLDICSR